MDKYQSKYTEQKKADKKKRDRTVWFQLQKGLENAN